jgi:hypothetical protein
MIISLAREFLPDILSKKKTSTIRRGSRRYSPGKAILHVGNSDISIWIEHVCYCRVNELTEENAARDGFDSLDDLLRALHRFYPGLSADETITIVSFSLEGDVA